ncbi:MAG: PIN domain-containing protein, partial [Caldimonas sp.]
MDIGALQLTLRRFAAELLQFAEQTSIGLHDGPGAKTHVLVDWENVQPDEIECRALVAEATDVWLFHGPTQKNVARRYATFGDRVQEVPIARAGKNSLDFHLSFYVGYLAAKQPDARVVVLSNDKGFGPMLEHARQLGFAVSQLGVRRGARKARKAPARKSAAKQAPARKKAAAAPSGKPSAKKTARKSAAKTTTAPKTVAQKTAAPTAGAPKAAAPGAGRRRGARKTAAQTASPKAVAARTPAPAATKT